MGKKHKDRQKQPSPPAGGSAFIKYAGRAAAWAVVAVVVAVAVQKGRQMSVQRETPRAPARAERPTAPAQHVPKDVLATFVNEANVPADIWRAPAPARRSPPARP